MQDVRKRVLRGTFGPEKDEMTGGWIKLHKKELHTLYSSHSLDDQIKKDKVGGTFMWEVRNVYKISVGKTKMKRPLERPIRRWEDNIKIDPK
jgi:hypothetical protein